MIHMLTLTGLGCAESMHNFFLRTVICRDVQCGNMKCDIIDETKFILGFFWPRSNLQKGLNCSSPMAINCCSWEEGIQGPINGKLNNLQRFKNLYFVLTSFDFKNGQLGQ